MIPPQLQKEEFRFVLIKRGEKAPFEFEWGKKGYKFNDKRLVDWVSNGHNYGIIGGYGNLLVIDFDDQDVQNKKAHLLPPTFTIKSGSGKLHMYYVCDDTSSWKILDSNKETLVDFLGDGKQAVAPNSLHPNGNKYQVVNDTTISTISIKNIKILFEEYLKEKDKIKKPYFSDVIVDEIKKKVSLIDLMRLYNYDMNRNPTMCNLGHDSKGGSCFSYNETEGLFYCFHCNVGGDIFNFIISHDNCTFQVAKDKLMGIAGISVKKEKFDVGDKDDSIIIFEIEDLLNNKKVREATDLIVEYINKKLYIYTTKDDEHSEMWIYDNGIYIPNAKCCIKEECRKILGERYTTFIVKEVIDKIMSETFIEQSVFFDVEDINKIAVENGILDLKEKILKPFSPQHIFFNKLPVSYDITKDCPIIKQHLVTVLKDEKDLPVIQELFGFLLYREYKVEKAFMFTGTGRNGKGKTLELMKRFLGIDNCSNIAIQEFEKDNFAKSELFNKLANLGGDISSNTLKETGVFKSLTGRDMISASRKFKTRVNFTNYAKMIFCANELPRTYDMTPAFFNRWVLIDFPYTFISQKEYDLIEEKEKLRFKIADVGLIDKISTPNELSGLLNWAIIGLHRLLDKSDFSYSVSTNDVKIAWIRKSDSIASFLMDCVEEQWGNEVLKGEMTRSYHEYCKHHKLKIMSEIAFNAAITTTYSVFEHRTSEARYWMGVKIKKIS